MAIFTTNGNSKCAIDGHEFQPKPTPEPHLAAAYGEMTTSGVAKFDVEIDVGELRCSTHAENAAWGHEAHKRAFDAFYDALMADVEQHRAAMTPQSPLTAVEVKPGTPVYHPSVAVTSQRSGSRKATPDESNAFFDALLLASRKRRERHNEQFCGWPSEEALDKAADAAWVRKEQEEAVGGAMSRPLTFSPLFGWKGKPIDE